MQTRIENYANSELFANFMLLFPLFSKSLAINELKRDVLSLLQINKALKPTKSFIPYMSIKIA